jgi:hypothetical protein
VAPGKPEVVRLRLTPAAPDALDKTYATGAGAFGKHFDEILQARRQEADEFYADVIPKSLDADAANVMRQALAGNALVQAVFLFRREPLVGRAGSDPYLPSAKQAPRNAQWHHMYNSDIISMPDKWEYPWYAAWDLAFHVLPLTLVDVDFGKQQLDLMLSENYLHPEWPDSRLRMELRRRESTGASLGHHLLLPAGSRRAPARATCCGWSAVSRSCCSTSPGGSTVRTVPGRTPFEGGFLGLDNIGVFDRSSPLPTWWLLGTGRRHRLDGALQLEHAGDRRGTGPARSDLQGHGAKVRPAFRLDCLGHDPRWRQHRHVG